VTAPPLVDELLDELELLDEELDDELLLEVEPVLLDELEDELELLELELLEVLPPAVIVPAEAVKMTLSSFAPSSRRSTRSV
jgi:hypothetical protein